MRKRPGGIAHQANNTGRLRAGKLSVGLLAGGAPIAASSSLRRPAQQRGARPP
jgi:hypothetical protein